MKIKEIIELKRAIDSLSAAKTPIWYELGKNKTTIERSVEPLFEDFNKARQLVIENLAEKDENGQFKVEDNKYVFGSNTEEAKNLLIELETGIDYNSINKITLTMAQPFGGTAYLS